jgi:uncharacterized protein YyaL (SSP411 family)
LADETSPYLVQHADNPVDWYPWGEEALAKARAEEKPIFLSVGYSACHWCHVMAHESFEDEAIAALLRERFVSVKVDREERPDLDSIYMSAVQAITGRGGWPMSVFLTPDGKPFYGGTYFPPERRYGMPSFTDVLEAVADAWQNRRGELLASGEKLTLALRRQESSGGARQPYQLSASNIDVAYQVLADGFDRRHGGWGGAPKFPQPMVLEFLLRYHHTTANVQALAMVAQTLDSMARGGMYDQIGGGFHRYSVDERWLVPHFEKMLYDNAQLARVYLHAWQVTGESLFRSVVEETLDYVMREMTSPEGGFYSTQDADSEGEEGKFFLWTPDQIRIALGDEADAFMAAYGVTSQGNFEGRSILELVGANEQRADLAGARRRLFAARRKRVHPGRDEKVLGSWNGLMLGAFAEAGRVLDNDDYRRLAERNAAFLLRELLTPKGRILHTWKDGRARHNGYLEDYAYVVEGLLELYETTFNSRWFLSARQLADSLVARFQAGDGGFYDTSDDHEALITRPRDLQDSATPSGNAMAASVLLKLAGLTGDSRYSDLAGQAMSQVQTFASSHPLGFGQWLQALSFAQATPREIAILGDLESVDARALVAAAQDGFRPFQVVAAGEPDSDGDAVPLLSGRTLVEGRAAAYVCADFTCLRPVTDPGELKQLLKGRSLPA